MTPQVSIPQSQEPVDMVYGKRDLADVNRLGALNWKEDPGLAGSFLEVITSVPLREVENTDYRKKAM
jgi:hypothetical protein